MKDLFWLRISVEKCVLSEQLKMLTLNRFPQFVLYYCKCRVAKKKYSNRTNTNLPPERLALTEISYISITNNVVKCTISLRYSTGSCYLDLSVVILFHDKYQCKSVKEHSRVIC